MKYVLCRFPDMVRWDPEGKTDPYILQRKKGVHRNKKGIPFEVVDVVYGNNIRKVTDVLVKIIQEEMKMTYDCRSDVFGPDHICDVIRGMTSEPFDYEFHAITRGFNTDADKEVALYFGVKECADQEEQRQLGLV